MRLLKHIYNICIAPVQSSAFLIAVCGVPEMKSDGRLSQVCSVQGPDLTDADVPQEDWVKCPDGRSYPRR